LTDFVTINDFAKNFPSWDLIADLECLFFFFFPFIFYYYHIIVLVGVHCNIYKSVYNIS
jgi:hypothetical protein